MKLLKNKLFAICILFFISACQQLKTKTEPTQIGRNPNSNSKNKEFKDSKSCESTNKIDPAFKLSGLSGYLVGAKAKKLFSNPKAPTLRPFTSDGCSASPDGVPLTSKSQAWLDCCIDHDLEYWGGGSKSDKRSADSKFKKCIQDKGYESVAYLYHKSVSVVPSAKTNFTYRWGYGWNYKRPYKPLNSVEKNQMTAMYEVENFNELLSHIKSIGYPLIRSCHDIDSAFNKLNKQEIWAYHHLNDNLQTDDRIDWAYWESRQGYNQIFVIKLDNCNEPIRYNFIKRTLQLQKIESTCF